MGEEEAIIYSYDIATIASVIPAFASRADILVRALGRRAARPRGGGGDGGAAPNGATARATLGVQWRQAPRRRPIASPAATNAPLSPSPTAPRAR